MLRLYQQHIVNLCLNNRYMGLFLDMGLGKTLIMLELLDRIALIEDIGPVLIIAPPMVVEHVWQEEAEKWGYNFTFSKVTGTPKQRIAKLKLKADIYLISSHSFMWLSEQEHNFRNIIIDEYSEFRSPKSNKFKALKALRPKLDMLYGLTGTPAPNGIYPIWGLIRNLDMGERLGCTQSAFQRDFFNPGKMNGYVVYNWIPKKGATDQIYKRISDICVSMKSSDHIDLPDFNTIPVYCSMDKKTKALYEQFKKDLVIFYDTGDLIAANAAVLVAKLQQFACGHVYLDTKDVQHIHNIKIELLKELILQCEGENVLIFYNFQFDKDLILKEIKDAEMLNVNKWNEGKQKVALLHPKTGGHGLNLQSGGHVLVWFSPIWDLEQYQQACKRVHRSGQKNKVLNYILTMKESIDTRIMSVLDRKAITQDYLFEILKETL